MAKSQIKVSAKVAVSGWNFLLFLLLDLESFNAGFPAAAMVGLKRKSMAPIPLPANKAIIFGMAASCADSKLGMSAK